jgi:hypothetical protein
MPTNMEEFYRNALEQILSEIPKNPRLPLVSLIQSIAQTALDSGTATVRCPDCLYSEDACVCGTSAAHSDDSYGSEEEYAELHGIDSLEVIVRSMDERLAGRA